MIVVFDLHYFLRVVLVVSSLERCCEGAVSAKTIEVKGGGRKGYGTLYRRYWETFWFEKRLIPK